MNYAKGFHFIGQLQQAFFDCWFEDPIAQCSKVKTKSKVGRKKNLEIWKGWENPKETFSVKILPF